MVLAMLLAVLLGAMTNTSSAQPAPAVVTSPASAVLELPPGAPDPNDVGTTHIHRPQIDLKCDDVYNAATDWKAVASDCSEAASTYIKMHATWAADPQSSALGIQVGDDVPDLWLLGYAARCDEQAAAAYYNGSDDVFGHAWKDASRTYARSAHAEAVGVLFALRTRFEGATREQLETTMRDVLLDAMLGVRARTEEHFPELAERN
jgi:hypothetical protein